MDSHPGRPSVIETALSPPSYRLKNIRMDSATATPESIFTATKLLTHPDPTISPFDTGLNGVNQSGNLTVKDSLWWSLGILALVILTIRIAEISWAHLRHVSAMSMPAQRQNFWKSHRTRWMPWLKKNLVYAPLWKKRHNREVRISSAISVGTLPSRFQSLVLGLYIGSNLAYMFLLDWGNKNKYSFCAELRGRSGTLALANMVPLIILATRNSPLIPLLKISFDTYNLLHRWMGRIVVVEVVIHTIAWMIVQVADGGWRSVNSKVIHDRFISSGTIGVLALILIFVLSVSPLRHAFYETFLNTHILLAFITFLCTWVHCVSASIPGGLPQSSWMMAIFAIWLVERLTRVARLVYYNVSRKGWTEAIVEPMPGDACRVTLRLPRYEDVQPGTHAYLRFMGVNTWENHPFSIAWVEHQTEDQVLPTSEKSTPAFRSRVATSVSFLIGAQTGFTRKLYNKAVASGKRSVALRAAFEGPYAGHHSLDSYGHVILFAGATGITHQLSYLRHLIEGYDSGVVATRRILVVWIVRDYTALQWVRPWMDKILRLPRRKEILRIKVFVTRPGNPQEIASPSNTVQMFPGRPNIPMLVGKEVQEQAGAMCVSVCGPGGLADDVRLAVREVQHERQVVDFIEESFTW
ncbi:hypothetical protein VTK73DRAFT_8956 [Phialemonium thermophilum]|uniref:FAD-binding FR-type domain-containing protein n=1 Tax=Phialemonium thermophilum TaxID=223376 RepID=A0ABR3Y536_9PEZI